MDHSLNILFINKKWLSVVVVLLFGLCAFGATPRTYKIESKSLQVTVSSKGEIISIFDKKNKITVPFSGNHHFEDCTVSVQSINVENELITIQKKVTINEKKSCSVTETLGFDIDGIAENRKYDFGKIGNLWTMDIQVLRFSEIQLLYAEAISLAAGSVQQQSLDLINEIRTRAGLGNIEMADVPNMNTFIEVVLAERRAEFVFEGKRYADLKRHNLLVQNLNAIGYNFDDSYNYLPIPQSEKDKVPDGLYD